MTSLTTIQTRLTEKVKYQETPIPLVAVDYKQFVIEGAQRLYVDGGLDSWDSDYNALSFEINRKSDLTETEYIYIASQIAFFNQIKNYWTTIVSYTTDAISVTGANNIFKTINGNVTDLELRLSQLAWKFSHRSV